MKFYEALKLVFNIERELYEAEIKDNEHNIKQIHKKMYQLIDQGDKQLNDYEIKNSSVNPLSDHDEDNMSLQKKSARSDLCFDKSDLRLGDYSKIEADYTKNFR